MQRPISRRRILAVLVAILVLLGGSCWQPGRVTAQASGVFNSAPYDQLAGIEYAVQRFYQTRTNIFLHAQVARFDTAANAALGLDALNAFYLDAFTTVSPPMVFEPVDAPVIGTTSYAFNAAISTSSAGEKNGEATLVQVHDDMFVYTVVAHNPYFDFNFVEVTFDAAIAMVEAMAASPDAIATPSVTDDGLPSSAWAKLPDQEAEVSARLDVYSTEDTVNFAVEPIPTSIISTYGEVEGLETVVARRYGLLDSASGTPEDVPTAVVELAAFDEAANAEPAFATAATAQLVALGLDDAGLAEAEAGIPADEAIAYTLDVEFEGEQYSVAVIVARSGPYVVTVSAVTSGDDALAFARELSRAVIEANAGTGEGSYSGVGTSTGGIWDKLPTTGDEVLDGLESLSDDQDYPELGGGF